MPEEIEISKLHKPFKLHMYFYQNCKSVQLPYNFGIYFTMFQPRRKKRFRESRNVYRAPAEKSRKNVRDPGLKVLFTLFDSSTFFGYCKSTKLGVLFDLADLARRQQLKGLIYKNLQNVAEGVHLDHWYPPLTSVALTNLSDRWEIPKKKFF